MVDSCNNKFSLNISCQSLSSNERKSVTYYNKYLYYTSVLRVKRLYLKNNRNMGIECKGVK